MTDPSQTPIVEKSPLGVVQDLFDSPVQICELMVALAHIVRGDKVLEPSAGIGNLALAAAYDTGAEVTALEIDPVRCETLYELAEINGLDLIFVGATEPLGQPADFLATQPEDLEHLFEKKDLVHLYDKVVMHPPFSDDADMRHVMHAHRFLKPGGRLVAVMSPRWTLRQDVVSAKFMDFVRLEKYKWLPLPDNSFEECGANVPAGILVLDKVA
jgi:SAM-dependent methyltransferase